MNTNHRSESIPRDCTYIDTFLFISNCMLRIMIGREDLLPLDNVEKLGTPTPLGIGILGIL